MADALYGVVNHYCQLVGKALVSPLHHKVTHRCFDVLALWA
jgi:hypothetical protein